MSKEIESPANLSDTAFDPVESMRMVADITAKIVETENTLNGTDPEGALLVDEPTETDDEIRERHQEERIAALEAKVQSLEKFNMALNRSVELRVLECIATLFQSCAETTRVMVQRYKEGPMFFVPVDGERELENEKTYRLLRDTKNVYIEQKGTDGTGPWQLVNEDTFKLLIGPAMKLMPADGSPTLMLANLYMRQNQNG